MISNKINAFSSSLKWREKNHGFSIAVALEIKHN